MRPSIRTVLRVMSQNDHRTAKLTVEDVVKIKARLALGQTPVEIAKDYPRITSTTIYSIRSGATWSSV